MTNTPNAEREKADCLERFLPLCQSAPVQASIRTGDVRVRELCQQIVGNCAQVISDAGEGG